MNDKKYTALFKFSINPSRACLKGGRPKSGLYEKHKIMNKGIYFIGKDKADKALFEAIDFSISMGLVKESALVRFLVDRKKADKSSFIDYLDSQKESILTLEEALKRGIKTK